MLAADAIACTLSAADMGPRLARIRQLTRTQLRMHSLQGSTLRLAYAPEAATELAAIVALERECCAFLAFELIERPGAVELVIQGPPQEGTDAQWLFSQFLPEGQAAGCGCGKG